MYIKIYDILPEESRNIRIEVFVKEQGFINEFDETDSHSIHFVLYINSDIPVATCRVFRNDQPDTYILGRLAVIKPYRNNGYGKSIVLEAEKHIKNNGGKYLRLHSQCRIKGFYKNIGYTEFGNIEYDEDCPHIWMTKKLVQE